ncbi:hypothetical protein LCGC14_1329570 [marine sediment metagenome]|uniref:Uncharacterized protein n=1 Tax=marine sediment metagenome TaxID=412755 RepID=A0A0F9KH10_9ZZZZ
MAKVRCKFCKSEQQGRCTIKKNTTIAINKKRTCSGYVIDEKKVLDWVEKRQNSSKPEIMLRPDWLWDRKARRKERDKASKEAMDQYKTTIEDPTVVVPKVIGSKHPVTGDLNRFLETNKRGGDRG